jgi:hypothetical protein
MHGIELKSGVNNCYWNINGKCTNTEVTRNKISQAFSRDWNSKQSCTYTILGIHLCGCYKQQK